MSQIPTGVVAPEFELKTLDGRDLRTTSLASSGAFVLVFFKASCPTCQLTFPFLERIHEERGTQVRIIAVSQDDAAETQEFIERFNIRFEVVLDEHPFDVSNAYGIENVPAIFVIDEERKIQLSDYGFSKATLSTIAQPLELFKPNDGLPAIRPG